EDPTIKRGGKAKVKTNPEVSGSRVQGSGTASVQCSVSSVQPETSSTHKVEEKPSQQVEAKGQAHPAREPMIGGNARPTVQKESPKTNVQSQHDAGPNGGTNGTDMTNGKDAPVEE